MRGSCPKSTETKFILSQSRNASHINTVTKRNSFCNFWRRFRNTLHLHKYVYILLGTVDKSRQSHCSQIETNAFFVQRFKKASTFYINVKHI
jgi:hypothetical protein